MTKLLIDADVLAYRAGFATDKTKYLVISDGTAKQLIDIFDDAKAAKEHAFSRDGTVWSRKQNEPEEKALMLVDVMLSEIRARYANEAPTVHLFLSGVGNYRNSIATRATYKGNRSGAIPPTHLRAIRSHLVGKHGAVVSAGEEADDLLGIAMSASEDCICVSIDKDLKQLPGRHYDFVKKEEVTISPKEAWLNFYSQAISGDATDNVPGLTGYGPVKARKALEGTKNNRSCWLKVLDLYKAEFGPKAEQYALECAQLVYVRRSVGDMFNAPVEVKAAA